MKKKKEKKEIRHKQNAYKQHSLYIITECWRGLWFVEVEISTVGSLPTTGRENTSMWVFFSSWDPLIFWFSEIVQLDLEGNVHKEYSND